VPLPNLDLVEVQLQNLVVRHRMNRFVELEELLERVWVHFVAIQMQSLQRMVRHFVQLLLISTEI
jgi:hypothetical protein